VGTSPGGGYDTFTRTIAPHFRQHLPGEPSVIVQNMPGAGSSILMSHLFTAAPRDGTAVGAVNPDVVTEPLMSRTQVRYDSRTMTWIGSALRETNLALVWHTSSIQTFDDVFERELIVPGTGGGTEVLPTFLNALLGTKFKVVRGYRGLKEGMLAMEKGEVAGTGSITWASLKATNSEWLRDGKVRLIVQYGLAKHAELPDVAWIYDYARSDADRAAMNLVFVRQEYGRPYVAPPGLGPRMTAVLRRAFDATMNDVDFLSDAKRRGLDIDPITGEQFDKMISDLYATPPAVVERVKAVLGNAEN
jgi:tripartite-type tricarboxylate transporter receptor subunit TctC